MRVCVWGGGRGSEKAEKMRMRERAGPPSQPSAVTARGPPDADLRNTTRGSRPLL